MDKVAEAVLGAFNFHVENNSTCLLDVQVKTAAEMSIQLSPFNPDLLKGYDENELKRVSLPDELNKVHDRFRTINYEGKPAGVVGFLPQHKKHWAQVLVFPEFRGKGLASKAEEELAKELGIRDAYATILKNNEPSLRAHAKAGYKPLDDLEEKIMRSYGMLHDSVLAFKKVYPHMQKAATFEDWNSQQAAADKTRVNTRVQQPAAPPAPKPSNVRLSAPQAPAIQPQQKQPAVQPQQSRVPLNFEQWQAKRNELASQGLTDQMGFWNSWAHMPNLYRFKAWADKFNQTPAGRRMQQQQYNQYVADLKAGKKVLDPTQIGKSSLNAYRFWENDPEFQAAANDLVAKKDFNKTVATFMGDSPSQGDDAYKQLIKAHQQWKNPATRSLMQAFSGDGKFNWGDVPSMIGKFFGGLNDWQKALLLGGGGLALGSMFGGGKGNWMLPLLGLGAGAYGAYSGYQGMRNKYFPNQNNPMSGLQSMVQNLKLNPNEVQNLGYLYNLFGGGNG